MSNNSKNELLTTETKPLITIVGILGKQGLSAAHSLIESGRYRVRGVTRRINSPEAVDLTNKGVELVNIPLDLGHYKAYVSAFQGSDGVFLMTPQIIPPATHEYELGKELADAAVEAGVGHVIFSSLENIDKISAGKLFAPHFTDKARIEEYIRTLPITSSFIYMAFFYTNFIEFYTPYQENDTLVFPIYLPKDFKAPFVDPLTATGPAVLEIFSKPGVYSGKAMPVIGDIISPQELVETFVRVTGKKAVYISTFTSEELLQHYPKFSDNNDLVKEFSGMVKFAVEYGYFQEGRDLQWSRRINPNSLNWEQFLKNTGWTGEKRAY
jgi:uncharacterized protein YbjT (DUF2867 family)